MSAVARFAWSLRMAQACHRDGYPATARAYMSEAVARAGRVARAGAGPYRFLRRPGGTYRFCHAQIVRAPVDRCAGAHGAALRRSIQDLRA